MFAVWWLSCWQLILLLVSPDISDSIWKAWRAISNLSTFFITDLASYQHYREVQERGKWSTSTFLAYKLQKLFLRDLHSSCCSKWEFFQGSLVTFVSSFLSSLLNDRTRSSKKSLWQTNACMCFLAVMENALRFSIICVFASSKQQVLAPGTPALTSVALEMRREKANHVSIDCRFIPALIYSPEFHNNFSNKM